MVTRVLEVVFWICAALSGGVAAILASQGQAVSPAAAPIVFWLMIGFISAGLLMTGFADVVRAIRAR